MRPTTLRSQLLPAAFLLLAVAGCSTEPSSSIRTSLEAGRARWASLNIQNYSFTMTLACFCGVSNPVRVTVQNGAVTSRLDVTTDTPIAANLDRFFPRIDGLFNIIEDALNTKADAVSVAWDQERGYPNNVLIDYRFTTVDDNISWNVKDFSITP